MCSMPGASRNSSPMSRRSSARKLTRVPAEAIEPRPLFDRIAHIGVHAQKQAGPELDRRRLAGRQDHRRADARAGEDRAAIYGDGDIRLTVWQNLLISGVADGQGRAPPKSRLRRSASRPRRASIRAGLVACTGSDRLPLRRLRTPRGMRRRSRMVRAARRARQPVNIHLTGCHHSCAQHYIGDIGLIACKVETARRRRSRAITSMSAAASVRTRRSAAKSIAT